MTTKVATGEIDEAPVDDGKDPAAKALGKKGGAARANFRSFAARALVAPERLLEEDREPLPLAGAVFSLLQFRPHP
ncbi:MAG: hypothetical protein JO234_01950 [Hyphomicrobiales bacterium]|nr:hypothetical protein [Hyphomicrobiales bacterium]